MENSLGVPNHTASFRGRRALIWVPLAFALPFVFLGKWNLLFGKLEIEGIPPLDLSQVGMIIGGLTQSDAQVISKFTKKLFSRYYARFRYRRY